ncbi:MAG: alpha/beta hydrolase, partial [Pseudomonadales bacterium]|nr:alpha/beta hydrolase [Pseudomonadales bacterium]
YAKSAEMNNPLISPFYAKELNGICPILLQIGTHETLLDETRSFAETARRSGVSVTVQEWPEMIHVWHNLVGRVKCADDAIENIGIWLKDIWKTRS